MELRHLQAFAAVAAEKNFTRAAQRLRIAQPPLSRQIQQLENELGVTLFTRTRHGAELTASGRALIDKANVVIRQAKDFVDDAQRSSGKRPEAFTLRLAITPGMFDLLNLVHLNHRRQCPMTTIEGKEIPAYLQNDALRHGQIDVGFLRPPIDSIYLRYESLFNERIVAVMAEGHPLAKLKTIGIRELAPEAVVIHDPSLGNYWSKKIVALGAQFGVTWNLRCVAAPLADPGTLMHIADGHSIFFGLSSAFTRIPEVTGIVVRPLKESAATNEVVMAWRASEEAEAVHRFVGTVRETFRCGRPGQDVVPIPGGTARAAHPALLPAALRTGTAFARSRRAR
jgi:DNA-binding transcriptional LysR family regulator